MNQITKTIPKSIIPNWLEPASARSLLHNKIDDFIASAASAPLSPENHPASALALRVTPGTGKTTTTLRAIASYAEPLLKRGNVLFYCPTVKLAERAAEEFRTLAPGVPCAVLRGREASRPDRPGETMCSRLDRVKTLSGLVPSITQAACRARNEKGEILDAPCAKNCAYLKQREFTGTRVVFLAHAYLVTRPPLDPDMPVALRVIDEKCWPAVVRTVEITVEDFLRLPPELESVDQPDHCEAVTEILHALQRKRSVTAALVAEGISAERLLELAAAEAAARPRLDIRPWDDDLTVKRRLDLFNSATFRASLKRQSIFELIAQDRTQSCNPLSLGDVVDKTGLRQVIKTHKLAALERDAPLLLLDADADPEISQRLVPGCDFAMIDAGHDADVIQISDRTLSNSWLLDKTAGAARRQRILALIDREVQAANGRGVLLIATRSVLRQLHEDAGNVVGQSDQERLLQPLLGATPRWIGPSTQGINDFKDYVTAIVVGRLQPRPHEIEDIARCIFGSDTEPLQEHSAGPLPHEPVVFPLANGDLADVRVSSHPDARTQAVLRQIRECGSAQAVARIRPVGAKSPKRILLLSNLPLPGLSPTKLVSFEAACRGLEDEPDPSGFIRLEAAFTAVKDRAVFGARLSASGLMEDLPRDFPTIGKAEEFRRGRSTDHMVGIAHRIAARNGWSLACLKLHRPKGGTPIPAVVFRDAAAATEYAADFWPKYSVKIAEVQNISSSFKK